MRLKARVSIKPRMNPSAAPYRLCEFKQALVSSQKIEQKPLLDGLVTTFIIKKPSKCYLP